VAASFQHSEVDGYKGDDIEVTLNQKAELEGLIAVQTVHEAGIGKEYIY
jgi:hypothetical protein